MNLRALGVLFVLAGCPGTEVTGTSEVPKPSFPPVATPEPSAPTVIACGASTCKVGAEVCCSAGDVRVCAPAVPELGTAATLQGWGKQAEECARLAATPYSLNEMLRCDDSGDCSNKRMCCQNAIGSDLGIGECTVFAEDRNSCEHGELCTVDAACKTSGASCIDGRCQAGPARDCAGTACGPAAPICCGALDGSPPSCGSATACRESERPARYQCARPSDCPKGEHCQSFLFGTSCQGLIDSAHGLVVCESDADCGVATCFSDDDKPSCAPLADETRPWLRLRVCTCRGAS